MIKRENYPNAYKEVYTILNNMEKDDIKEIPINVIDKIKEKMNDNYKFELDPNKELEQQVLLKETKVILAYLFLNYLATENQKEVIINRFNSDIIKNEKLKGEYSGNLFEKNSSKNIVEKKNSQIIVYKKESIFLKIFRFLKKMFIQ